MGSATSAALVFPAAFFISTVAGSSAASTQATTRHPLFRTLHKDSLDDELDAQAEPLRISMKVGPQRDGRVDLMVDDAELLHNSVHGSQQREGAAGVVEQEQSASFATQQEVRALERKLADLQERSSALEEDSRRAEQQREFVLEKQFAELKANVDRGRNSTADAQFGTFQDAFHFVASAMEEEAGNPERASAVELEDMGVHWPEQHRQREVRAGGDLASPRRILSLIENDLEESTSAAPLFSDVGPVGPPGPPGPKGPNAPEWQNNQGFVKRHMVAALLFLNCASLGIATVALRACAREKLEREKAEALAGPVAQEEWTDQGWQQQEWHEDIPVATTDTQPMGLPGAS